MRDRDPAELRGWKALGASALGLTTRVQLCEEKPDPASRMTAAVLALTRLYYLIGEMAGSSFLFYWHSIIYIE